MNFPPGFFLWHFFFGNFYGNSLRPPFFCKRKQQSESTDIARPMWCFLFLLGGGGLENIFVIFTKRFPRRIFFVLRKLWCWWYTLLFFFGGGGGGGSPKVPVTKNLGSRTLPRAAGVSQGPPGPKSQKSLKRVSRGGPQKVWKKSRKSPKSLEKVSKMSVRDFFRDLDFSRLLGAPGPEPGETLFRLFWDFRPGGPERLL